MSVQTEADIKRDAAKEAIDEAIKALSGIVVDKCCGWEDYKPEYQGMLCGVLHELLVLERKF